MYTARDTTGAEPLGVQAYRYLKHRLLVGDFALGLRLGEVTLADQLEMSRTPIREALSRLNAEGLVVRLPDGGFSPAAPDLHTIGELYEVRRGLEFTALRRGGHDPALIAGLLADWQSMDEPESDDDAGPDFVLHDEDFHLRLAAAAGNQALVDMLIGVNERIRMVRMHDFLTADRIRLTISEHVAIARSLLDHGPECAGAELDHHLEVSEQVVEQRAALALSRMVATRRG